MQKCGKFILENMSECLTYLDVNPMRKCLKVVRV